MDSDKKAGVIYIDSRLEPIFPKFLSSQNADFAGIKAAYEKLDYEEMARLGHRMRGTCGGYGLVKLGELAGRIERAAEARDAKGVSDNIQSIEEHFQSLQIQFKKT